MKITGNEPYHIHVDTDKDGGTYTDKPGITIRQAFAMAAMQGIRASQPMLSRVVAAELAVRDADALIAELNKEE